jgi:hypothetical protein
MRLALALMLLSSTASATCMSKGRDFVDFDALRACQDKERLAFIDATRAKKKRLPTEAELDGLEERQRGEAREFFAGRTQGVSDMDLASEADAPPKRKDPENTHVIHPPSRTGPAKKLQGPLALVEGQDGMTQGDLDFLRNSLGQKSDHGKKGVTPEMAGDMRKMLMQKQGSVSPDMSRLLDLTSRDGANLSQETMEALRDAGKQAKGAGMNLNIDPDTERQLLEDDLTPSGGRAGPGTN